MVRNISPTSLATLRTVTGTEPLNVLAINWANLQAVPTLYCDRVVQGYNFEPRILEIGGLDDTLKLSENSSSQSVSVKLSDYNGALKNIIDNLNIHKQKVYVYQWFTSIPFSEAFIIFEGQIWSPITWEEGTQTLSFDVVSRLEDKEIGFSLEQGQINPLDEQSVGQAWPLGFGTNIRVATFKINSPPQGVTRNPIAWPDPSLYQKIAQNALKIHQYQQAYALDEMYAAEAGYTALDLKFTLNILQNTLVGLQASQDLDQYEAQLKQYNTQAQSDANSRLNDNTDTMNTAATYNPPEVVSATFSNYTPDAFTQDVPQPPIFYNDEYIKFANNVELFYQAPDINALQSLISQVQSTLSSMESAQKQYESKAASDASQLNQILDDQKKLTLELSNQSLFAVKSVSIVNGSNFPRGVVKLRMGGVLIQGSFAGDVFTWTRLPQDPDDPKNLIYNPADKRDIYRTPPLDEYIPVGKFVVVNPGSTVQLVSNYPVYYAVNIIPSAVFEVVARQSVEGGAAILTPVPKIYYTVTSLPISNISDNTIFYNVTVLQFNRALSTYNQGWEDEVFVSYTSSIGPNTVDILSWLIATYTYHTVDAVSFIFCKNMVDQYPSNFVTYDRKNIVTALEEICFQARLGIALRDGIFYLKYLPLDDIAVDTITEDDIEANTLQLTGTPTEEIVTKLVGNYKLHYVDKLQNQIVVRYNINLYDTIERTFEYYIYNIPGCVYVSLTYWAIRKGNSWKKIKFKAFLNKLNLEPLDTVLINFANPFVASGPVKGIVEEAKYDSASNSIEMEVWLPVRMGEMTEYPFAYPSGVSPFFYFPVQEEITDGAIGQAPAGLMRAESGLTLPESHIENTPDGVPSPFLDNMDGRSKDAGVSNVSDNWLGQGFMIPEFELGTVGTDQSIGPATSVGIDQNYPTTIPSNGQTVIINGQETVVQSSISFSSGPKSKRTTVSVSPPVNVGPRNSMIGNVMVGGVDNKISDYTSYNYRSYLSPLPPAPPTLTPPVDSYEGTVLAITFQKMKTYNTYLCDSFPKGEDQPSTSIIVNILDIDPAAQIPQGTRWFAFKRNGKWYAQVAEWITLTS